MTSISEDNTIDREEEQGLISGHLTSSPEGLQQAAIAIGRGKRWNRLKKAALLSSIIAGCILISIFDYGGSSIEIVNGRSMRVNNRPPSKMDASWAAPMLGGSSKLRYEALGGSSELEPLTNRRLPCDFAFTKVDPACPRFLHMDFLSPTGAGLGDKFFQLVVALAVAVDTQSVLINPASDMGVNTHSHGDYEWVPQYFRLDLSSNMTYQYVEETYKPTHVGLPGHEKYRDRIAGLNTQCNVMIDIDIDSCQAGKKCYFAEEPRAYEHVRNMMGCWFLHSDRSTLPTLLYDPEWYNVAIHLRVGDISLLGNETGARSFRNIKQQLDIVLDLSLFFPLFTALSSPDSSIFFSSPVFPYNPPTQLRVGDITLLGGDAGARFFRNIKQQLDIVLDHFPVHYYFIAEDPEAGNNPPASFEFLEDIYGPFEAGKEKQEEEEQVRSDVEEKAGQQAEMRRKVQEEEEGGQQEKRKRGLEGKEEKEGGGPRCKVSYLNHLDVKSAVHHQMNADMLLTTGSSFPLVAATISPKPIVLFSKPKEGGFFGVYMRHDLAVVGDDGMIASPSLVELQALAKIRYLEVHDKVVPYDR